MKDESAKWFALDECRRALGSITNTLQKTVSSMLLSIPSIY